MRGVTLLIVLAILGCIAAIAVPDLISAKEKVDAARVRQAEAEVPPPRLRVDYRHWPIEILCDTATGTRVYHDYAAGGLAVVEGGCK